MTTVLITMETSLHNDASQKTRKTDIQTHNFKKNNALWFLWGRSLSVVWSHDFLILHIIGFNLLCGQEIPDGMKRFKVLANDFEHHKKGHRDQCAGDAP